jgi:hypothetical protein
VNDTPIDMVLHCPKCHTQHIDKDNSDEIRIEAAERGIDREGDRAWENWIDEHEWTNPPHRSHLCHQCGHIWRPADVPTNGVQAIKTRGKADKDIETTFTPIAERDDVLPKDGWQYPFESNANTDVAQCYVYGDTSEGVVHVDGALDVESLERLAAYLRAHPVN